MPCFNTLGTLQEALDSLDQQTLPDFEIVAVDDGSADGTLQLLRDRARDDHRLRVISQTHCGIVVALNTGLEACRAAYIARMDADDYSYPDRLALQAEYLDAHPEVAVVGCLVEGFPRQNLRQGFEIYIRWQNSLIHDAEIRREIFIESPFAHPSVTFRKEWVVRAGGYQEHGWAEDYDLWLRLHAAQARFAKVKQVLLGWREHPKRLTRTDGRYSLENFIRAKASYLAGGPLAEADGVLIWGAGMIGRRLSKHLLRHATAVTAFIDIDPRKIGRTRRGLPILPPEALPGWRQGYSRPVILAAVGARGARQLIRQQLEAFGLIEGVDWWGVA
jgi:glycosyltransferase involved in cell wall biosynthesis